MSNDATSSSVSTSSSKQRKVYKKWEEDGVEGGPSSNDILLDWITTNYARWKGDAGGTSKQTLCGEVVCQMKEAGIYHRNATDIRSRISAFQTSYNKARDWLENTGEGIQAEGGKNAEATIKGMFWV
jgi:hypothetical protein